MLKVGKKAVALLASAALAISSFALVGCSSGGDGGSSEGSSSAAASSGEISVYSREDGSGTRSAFVELVGLEEEGPDGDKVDMTTDSAVITNSTAVMMTSVASDPDAIGYISLGSLNDTVKALAVDGVEATPENVKDGSYTISRPFNIVTSSDLTPQAEDFISFIMSAEGQGVVEENGYVAVNDSAEAYEGGSIEGKIVVAGSSSVTPVMEKLAEAYKAINPNATVEVQQSDSTTGVNMAAEGTCDIGMASRDLKDSEAASGVSAEAIAKDGIAVIVAPSNSLDGLTAQQIRDIFAGDALSWADLS